MIGNALYHNTTGCRSEMPSAPLAVSSQSRKKLKSFLFAEKSRCAEDDKENGAGHNHSDEENTLKRGDRPNDSRAVNHLNHSQSPRTPANKIPFEDLIGNTEDALKCAHTCYTPEDQVDWAHGPWSSDPPSRSQSRLRGKRRAPPTSSPTSSSHCEKPEHLQLPPKGSLDLQHLQEALKTPLNDPAGELWTRYATGNLHTRDDTMAQLAYPPLLMSSPRTPSTTNSKDTGLKRSISCGIEWPSSKKRKVLHDPGLSYGPVRDIFASSKSAILAQDKPKNSRVNLLVEKLHESLSRRPTNGRSVPSSSSPLPERADTVPGQPGLPSSTDMSSKAIGHQDLECQERETCLRKPDQEQNRLDTIEENSNSSEFGDPELDLDLFEAVERASIGKATQEAENIREVDGGSSKAAPGLTNGSKSQTHQSVAGDVQACQVEEKGSTQHQPSNAHDQQHSDDEFSLNDDALAMEMQDLAERYDTQGTSVAGHEIQSRLPRQHLYASTNEKILCDSSLTNSDEMIDDDDDLWAEIDAGYLSPQGNVITGSTSQVGIFHKHIPFQPADRSIETDQ